MSVAGTAAITEMWAKCKAWFGRKLGASTTATTISIHLKNNAGDVLETATIAAASTTDAGPMSADDKTKLNGIATGATANAATTTTPKMDGTAAVGTETAYAKGDHVHPTDTSRQATLVSGTNIKTIGSQSILGSGNLTPANIGAAASSHAHGNITSGGDITASAPTIASGDRIVINDDSASKITNGPAFGTSTTTFLANNGTWQTPAGTSYSDFTGASSSAAGTHGLVPAPAQNTGNARLLNDDGTWKNVNLGYLATATDVSIEIYSQNGSDTSTKKTLSGSVSFPMATATALQTTSGFMSYADKAKLDGITAGAQPNQNAFSNVKVGSTTVAADAAADTLELVAGSNVTLTPNATNDSVTIAATDNDTKNTAGIDSSTSPLYLVGSTTAPTSGTNGTARTYANSSVYATDGVLFADSFNNIQLIDQSNGFTITNGTSGIVLDSAGVEILYGLSGGTPRTGLGVTDGNVYILNDACAKGVDTSISAGSTSTNLPTSQAVAAYIATQMTGAATFKGTLVASGGNGTTTWTEAQVEAAAYKKGWYWVCQTASTPGTPSTYYAGNCLEVGDMLFCVNNKGNAYAASDFTAIQNNLIEMTTDEVDAICV